MRCLKCSLRFHVLILAIMIPTTFTSALAQTESILYSFSGGLDGGGPQGGVILDSKGNLYGTTSSGGANGVGSVFKLTPNSSGKWTEQVLYSFNGFADQNDGIDPFGALFSTAKAISMEPRWPAELPPRELPLS
jgi:uncharacterized repeat protein (TIGR03803 family)